MEHYTCLKTLMTNHGFPEPNQPLFALINLKVHKPEHHQSFTSDFYGLTYFKPASPPNRDENLKLQRMSDFQVFLPNQVLTLNPLETVQNGYILFFHKNFCGEQLLKRLVSRNDTAILYDSANKTNAQVEEKDILNFFHLIEYECYPFDDEFSNGLIINYITGLLIYKNRINSWESGRHISA